METTNRHFGCVPVRYINAEHQVLLILHKKGGHWGLPKGGAEEGETPEQTALRELMEETGLMDCPLDTSRTYSETHVVEKDGVQIQKTVKFFFCTVPETEPVAIDRSEIIDYRWLPFPEAVGKATYEETRQILREAARDLGISLLATVPETFTEEE